MTNSELSNKILELVGGKDNIVTAANCMTRLRLTLKDVSAAQKDEIKKAEGVLGLVQDGNTLQIVVGPGKAKKLMDIFREELGVASVAADWQENKAAMKAGQKQNGLKKALRTIAEIFIPLIPAIIAAGLFNGLASLLGQMMTDKVIAADGFWSLIKTMFSLIGGGFLGYFAIYTGINAAKKFGATEALGGMVGAMSIMAQIVDISKFFGLYNETVPLESVLTTGKGGIMGVIVGVWILAKIERWVRKRVPDVLDLIVTPLVSLFLTAAIFVLAIMPAAGFISDWLVKALSVIINSGNPVVSVISGYVLSAVFLPMVLLGLHHGLIPIYAIQLEKLGGVSLFPVLAMAGAGQVGAAIAIYLKAKKVGNARMRKVIAGALPAGLLGVGEPLIYGVTLPMGKPFVTAGLGAGFGGAYVMFTHVMSIAWGPSGLVAIPLMSNTVGMLNFFIGLVIAYVAGFIITYVGIKDADVANV
ncbi:PTS system IIB component (Glc family) /PTS system IIC component (Glc family) [Hydrogenoanaerobacterium saccharovorans]|uniref:PTS system IIB component, Glc family /PTS system IIC component, Glc family n=1 Tax=Hydrogenoanaerobacterium saccharovorans TaxID=474960 RepID=A0A1H8BQ08_9FIRM|nr:PTS transporter subunit EIIC [Hydrogenoanaerobacterium saccharovorans]RPF47294.1 PTS system IIB component (Glc family) /PTS system IIC component (Glc family) [Hydrogenoanaerobacterium saccharovorans]SEM84883.1 PTS system IIB component, Glc family /PTS system IIC component, Glc family [Hydrogenoanaerobacterium saccharovorans]